MASKSKKNQTKQKPPPLRSNLTVRECLTWHFPKGYVSEEPSGPQERYLPSKGGIGQAKSRGYDTSANEGHVIRPRPDDGTVIEALRGWPHDRRRDDFENYGDGTVLSPIDTQGQGDKPGDPWMTDLISHRFMNDAIRRRQQEEEEEMNKLAAARAKKGGVGKADIKGNRTSQLRAIALAQKVEISPHDLWQLPKFKNNAKPHLTTTQTKQKTRNSNDRVGSARLGGSARIGSGRGDPCVCDTNKEEFDYKDYFTNGRYSPKYNYDFGATGDVDPVFNSDQTQNEIAVM